MYNSPTFLASTDEQNVMMVPREQAVLQAPLAPAEHDIKSIVNKMGQKMMRRDQQYQGEDVDFTQQPEKRLWRGRLGRRGPLRQRQEEEQVQEAQEVSCVETVLGLY